MSIKTNMTAKVLSTKILDVMCPTDSLLYSAQEHQSCVVCQSQLVPLIYENQRNCITEAVLYPLAASEDTKKFLLDTEKASGILYNFRLHIPGSYNTADNTITPSEYTSRLQPDQVIQVELDGFPNIKEYFPVQEKRKLSYILTFHEKRRDTISFLNGEQTPKEFKIKVKMTATIGFTKLLNRTCPNDGGLYASTERTTCNKCKAELVAPKMKSTRWNSDIPYCITEVTLYPLGRKGEQDAVGALPFELDHDIRMILWGIYDKENDVAVPDKRTRLLVPKRKVKVEFDNFPILKEFTTRDNKPKVEIKFTGHEIELLDSKQEHAVFTKEAKAERDELAAPIAQQSTTQQTEMKALNKKVDDVVDMFQQLMGKMEGKTMAVGEDKVESSSPDPTDHFAAGNVNNDVEEEEDPFAA